MPCPALHTGQQFLATTLTHIDCQAQTLGSYGYGALADPGSPVSLTLTSLLTVFIALFGIRLLLNYPIAGRDVVTDMVKIGIVLTLATSWPAWRVLGYDLVINGPVDIARTIGLATGLPGSSGDLIDHLQRIDDGLTALNGFGSGRLGVAQGDWFQLGFAHDAFLTGTLVSLGLLRIVTGILLAIAPLMAGLLLFGITLPVFVGWARGLVLCFLGSVALTLVFGTELALLEPWLQDTLVQRAADQQTLSAPSEILVMTLAFALIALGALAVAARIAFHPGMLTSVLVNLPEQLRSSVRPIEPQTYRIHTGADAPSRAEVMALSVAEHVRREERLVEGSFPRIGDRMANETTTVAANQPAGEARETLGTSYRRTSRRVSRAATSRDQTS